MTAIDYTQQWTDSGIATQVQQPATVEITPEYVSSLTAPTPGFLCPLSANTYGIDFVNFKIRSLDEDSAGPLFEVDAGDEPRPPLESMDDNARFIQYDFGPDFLNVRTVGTTLEFTIGDQPLHNFRMIERHYFRNQLLASYDFTLPFVIPNTKNTWEMIYTKPELSEEWRNALLATPWETKSDSFFFVEGKLVMHNRAEYSFVRQ